MEAAREKWAASGFPVPSYLLGFYDGKYYVTTSDASTVCFFASKKGRIYTVVKAKCKVVTAGTVQVYLIDNEPHTFQVVSCRRPSSAVDRFAVDYIVPLLSSTI
ncbi:Hypothetical protein POVN_LOCUS570 [uncultured virus]|nr:Hypothetical protein POVN_LOCUS570 [uncultured virus]